MTKENILKIATQEFSKYGYDAVSMNSLASKLDVNKATIYYHFKDKKSLYKEVLGILLDKNKQLKIDILQNNMDPKEKFQQYINAFLKTQKEYPEVIPIALREMANFGLNVDKQIGKEMETEVIYLKEVIGHLNLKSKYKDMDIYTIKALIVGTVNSYYSIQMSNLEFNGLSDFNKNGDDVLDYLGNFISNILLDALCEN